MKNQRNNRITNRLKLSLIPLLLSTGISYAENSSPLAQPAHHLPTQTFLAGSWTGQSTGDMVQKAIYPSQGIYRVRLNSDGSLLPLDMLKLASPSWIVFSHNNKFAYTTNENDAGSVTALRVEKHGKLSTINQADSLGSQPTHATITLDDKYLIAANYSVAPGHAGITLFPLRTDGAIEDAVQHIPFIDGSHVVKDRQDGGHAHSVNMTPDGKMLFVADLGADTVHAFSYHAEKSQPLTAEPDFDLHFKPGEGPRHMTFSSDGKFAYISTEMSAKVHVYRIEHDKLSEIQVVDLTESKNPDDKGGAGILFSPDHKFLYVGNRRKVNQIVVFKADPVTGKLTLTKRFSSGGIEPRAFAFDKTGQYMIVANVFSNNVVELRRNTENGDLTPTAVTLQIGTPTDIKFVN